MKSVATTAREEGKLGESAQDDLMEIQERPEHASFYVPEVDAQTMQNSVNDHDSENERVSPLPPTDVHLAGQRYGGEVQALEKPQQNQRIIALQPRKKRSPQRANFSSNEVSDALSTTNLDLTAIYQSRRSNVAQPQGSEASANSRPGAYHSRGSSKVTGPRGDNVKVVKLHAADNKSTFFKRGEQGLA